MTDVFHSILGLPGSGKTTYLAALWHLVQAGDDSIKLTLDKFSGDYAYLNKLADSWLRCEEIERTSTLAEQSKISLTLRNTETKETITLSFPDLAGESFEAQFSRRRCSAEYVNSFENQGGILLFINADRAQDGLTILDLGPIDHAEKMPDDVGVVGDERSNSNRAPRAKAAAVPWNPSLVPEQAKLVDLLQFLQRPPFRQRRRKIALVVSAWDVIDDASLTPSQWLSREMPLLHQFLSTNGECFEVRVFGISAQGGDVTGEAKRDLLNTIPVERVFCVGPEGVSKDLTLPLAWLSASYAST